MCLLIISVGSAPQNVSAIAISAMSILLKWTEPASLNGILHDYRIRYKLAMQTTYNSPISVGRQLNYTIVGLRPYSDYELQVMPSLELFLDHLLRLAFTKCFLYDIGFRLARPTGCKIWWHSLMRAFAYFAL